MSVRLPIIVLRYCLEQHGGKTPIDVAGKRLKTIVVYLHVLILIFFIQLIFLLIDNDDKVQCYGASAKKTVFFFSCLCLCLCVFFFSYRIRSGAEH